MSRDALIVGINTYDKVLNSLDPLKNPAQDAEQLAQLLEKHGNFRVTRLPEMIEDDKRRIDPNPLTNNWVTTTKLKEALAQLFNPKGKNFPETALFFFAGHGLREETGGFEEGYLATSDVCPRVDKRGVPLHWLRRLLERSPIRQQIIWLDCCHSGEVLNFDEGNPGDKGKARDRCFIAASREFEAAYEQLAGNHGVLTSALLEGLDPTHKGSVNNHILVDFVAQRLKGEIQQPLFYNSGEQIILTATQETLVITPKDTLKSISEVWPDFDLDNYAQRVKTRYRALDLSVLTPPARDDTEAAPSLKAVFVPQQVKASRPPRELPKEIWEKLHKRGEFNEDELPEVLQAKDLKRVQETWAQAEPESVLVAVSKAANNRLILLGDPGSGKSTLARYLLLSVLEPPRDANGLLPDWVDTFSGHLPLLVELRNYIAEIVAKNCLGFLEYFHYLGKTQGYTLNHQALKEQLKTRASLVIFDGLDEIFEPRARQKIMQEIIGFAGEYPKARVIVTSRIIGYQGKALQAAEFREYTLQDLELEQIQTFARGWFNIVYQNQPDKAKFRYQRIDDALQHSPAIRALAGNPLLLTMIAIIAKHQELPRERAKLYEHAAKVLCHHWDVTGHEIPVTETPADFMLEDNKLELLRRIAWRMQAAPQGLAGNFILQEDLQAEIEAYLKERWQLLPVELTRIGSAMITQLRERNFILCLYGAQVYGFVHRTFLEYFCAAEIVYRFEKQQTLSFDELKTAVFLAHYQDETWHEVLQLICGMVASHFTGQLVEMLVSYAKIGKDRYNPLKELLFAKACLDEAIEQGQVKEVSHKFQIKLRQLTSVQNEFVRRAAIRALVKHYTQNPEVLLLLKQVATDDKHEYVRSAAVESLAEHYTQNPEVLPLLKQAATDDKNNLVRHAAVESLAKHYTQNPEVLPLLKQFVTDNKYEDVRRAAVESLAKHYTQNPEVLPLLKQFATDNKYEDVRGAAVYFLAEHYSHNLDVLPLLKQVTTDDKDEWVRRAAVESLAQHYTQNPEVLPLLKQFATNNEDKRVRWTAVHSLAKHYTQNPEVLPLLKQVATDDKGEWVRRTAVCSLAKYYTQNPEVLPLLKQVATDDDEDECVRSSAVYYLAEYYIQDPEVLPLHKQLATDNKDKWVRHAAVESLAKHYTSNSEVLSLLRKIMTDEEEARVRQQAVEGIAKHYDDAWQILLSQYLNGIEPWLDPKAFIDDGRVEEAAEALQLSPETIRQHYEAIAQEIPLRLSWIPK
jgi:HEAT repeat protein/energy-coupling factor transporter ATP-binding protein EcfA2